MSEYCVVVADAWRARLFTLEQPRSARTQSGPNLVEARGMVNPELEMLEREAASEPRSGGNRAAGAGVRSYDDHRGKHELEVERRFARAVVDQVSLLLKKEKSEQLVLCASTRMLGLLRKALDHGCKAEIHDVALDMTKMTARAIHDRLAKGGTIPPCERKSRTWRSCAQETRKSRTS
jgi:protein required for attachment to host cells